MLMSLIIMLRDVCCGIGDISSGWTGSGVLMGDFNAIRLHSKAFGGSPSTGDMKEFDMAIREVDLAEPSK